MPKLKTHKATAKRIQITKSGKLKRLRAYRSHNRAKKAPDRKRAYRRPQDVAKGDEKKIRRLLGI